MQRKPDVVEIVIGAVVVAAVIFVLVYGKGSSTEQRVAVINVEEVARQLGRDVEFSQIMRQKSSESQAGLARTRNLLQQNYKQKEEEFGETPTPEQKKTLETLRQQMAFELNQTMQRGKQAMTNFQMEMMQQFRTEIDPIVREIAKQRGIQLVLRASPNVIFSADEAIDITGPVVQQLQLQALSSQNVSPPPDSSDPSPGDLPGADSGMPDLGTK